MCSSDLRERIIGALGGLVFLIAATAFLNIINPQLTTLKVGDFDEVSAYTESTNNSSEYGGAVTDADNTTGTSTGTGGGTGSNNPITTSFNSFPADEVLTENLYDYLFADLPESAFIDLSKVTPSLFVGTGVQSDTPPVNINSSSPAPTATEIAAATQRNNNAKELRCMAMNIYYEAVGESTAGQEMVAHVTWNRVQSGEYPTTVCAVVYQTKPSVQFSWILEPAKKNKVPKNKTKLAEMTAIAHRVMYKGLKPPSPFDKPSVMFYKRTDNKGVSNRSKIWFAKLRQIGAVGAHTFYCAK